MLQVFIIYLDDGIASRLRILLRKKCPEAIEKLDVVYSDEIPIINLLPLDENSEKEAPKNRGGHEYMRTRILPVMGTIPAIFGQTIATHVLNTLAKLKYSYY